MADSKKYNGSTWEHSLRKLTTSTDTLTTLPADIYADGNNATVGLKGNTVQNGTPTPDNPIMPEGCGDLETVGAKAGQYKIPISSANTTTPVYLGEVETTRKVKKLVLTGEEGWYISTTWKRASTSVFYFNSWDIFNKGYSEIFILSNKFEVASRDELYNEDSDMIARTGTNSITIRVSDSIATTVANFESYLAAQYANGTPVTIWYVLANEETAVVNEPLMRIGDYADTVSGITIPTITSKDTFDVDTTLKPSEVSLSYTGWHDATVEEWDGSQWQ